MNIYEIAEMAGVSPTTVSRVLNGNSHVSKKNKNKVESIINEYGYVPNFFARGLNLKRTKTVGILCPVISDLHHANQVAALEHRLRRFGFDIILCSIEQNYDDKEQYLELLLQKHIDAIFVIGARGENENDAGALKIAADVVPVILLNAKVEYKNIYSVYCNEKTLAENAVKQLYLSGKKNIIYIYDTLTYSSYQKKSGYENGMQSCCLNFDGLELKIDESVSMSDIQKTAHIIAEHISTLETGLDAILCTDDILAVPAEKACKQVGVSVPIIGWNNSMYAQISTPTITSVDIKIGEMSDIAVTILLNLLNKRNCPQNYEVNGEIIYRDSYSI